MPPTVDYSVYLVTDNSPAILGAGRTVEDVVRAALAAPGHNVGIVQLRDKDADAKQLVETLRRLHVLTSAAGIPLVINDRVDVAAAAGPEACEGVHLGQDDLDVATARRLLGPEAIVGVTASTIDEAVQACRDGADYLGLGTVFATATKKNTKHVVGPVGVQRMLEAVVAAGFGGNNNTKKKVQSVCIGSVNARNARRVVFQASAAAQSVDGIAVVSAIMGAADPGQAAVDLASAVKLGREQGPTAFYRPGKKNAAATAWSTDVLQPILAAVHKTTPLSHNMTNLVVQNFAANVALAVGASPIMANNGAEAADLARLPGSTLVVNMGSATADSLANYVQAIGAYNAAGRPIVFDPVGAGATSVRREAVRSILWSGYLDVIKGNEGEILTVDRVLNARDQDETKDDDTPQQRGVDGSNTLDAAARIALVRRVAARTRSVIVLTGVVDYVCDGRYPEEQDIQKLPTVAIRHGHPLLGQVTGTGCTLGTVISAAVAADPEHDTFAATVAGMVLFERAAELAVASAKGPGSFVPAFLDALAASRKAAAEGDMAWVGTLQVQRVE